MHLINFIKKEIKFLANPHVIIQEKVMQSMEMGNNMMEIMLMVLDKVRESIYMQMGINMKVILRRIRSMVLAN